MRSGLLKNTVCWILALVSALPSCLLAQTAEEGPVKAAFVYNFIVFTEWPANSWKAGETIGLCVSAKSPAAQSFTVLDGKPLKGSRLKLQKLDSLADVPPSCRILFVDRLDRSVWPQVRRQLGNAGVLTVSDDSEINAGGAIISLFTHNNRIVFEIDAQAAGRSGLTLNSKLLRLARKVR